MKLRPRQFDTIQIQNNENVTNNNSQFTRQDS